VFPGLDGGAEWGGAAVDPDGIMYLNSSEMAWLIALNPKVAEDKLAALTPGHRVYATSCTSCHGPERKGNPASGFPSLVNIGSRRTRDYVATVIANGKGMMPAFSKLSGSERQALVAFLFGDEKQEAGMNAPKSKAVQEVSQAKAPVKYGISGYTKFLDADGYPAIKPPWGTLNAINLNTGEYVWKTIFGEHQALAAKGVAQTGSESYGGPVVTASGLLFIAGTADGKFRVYDKKTGKLLWQTQLPAAGFATPSTYQVNGRQYVVVACGGTKLGAKKGDSYVAFALE
jgi:quinoprotein glucose dehydrogenase